MKYKVLMKNKLFAKDKNCKLMKQVVVTCKHGISGVIKTLINMYVYM